MHEIHPNQVRLGHALDIREPRALFDVGIRAVVDVAIEEPPVALPRELIYCRFPIHDGGDELIAESGCVCARSKEGILQVDLRNATNSLI